MSRPDGSAADFSKVRQAAKREPPSVTQTRHFRETINIMIHISNFRNKKQQRRITGFPRAFRGIIQKSAYVTSRYRSGVSPGLTAGRGLELCTKN